MSQRTTDDIAREIYDLYADYYLKMKDLADDRIKHLADLQREWMTLTGGIDEDWITFIAKSATGTT